MSYWHRLHAAIDELQMLEGYIRVFPRNASQSASWMKRGGMKPVRSANVSDKTTSLRRTAITDLLEIILTTVITSRAPTRDGRYAENNSVAFDIDTDVTNQNLMKTALPFCKLANYFADDVRLYFIAADVRSTLVMCTRLYTPLLLVRDYDQRTTVTSSSHAHGPLGLAGAVFACAECGPTIWNKLSQDLQSTDNDTREQFKRT